MSRENGKQMETDSTIRSLSLSLGLITVEVVTDAVCVCVAADVATVDEHGDMKVQRVLRVFSGALGFLNMSILF